MPLANDHGRGVGGGCQRVAIGEHHEEREEDYSEAEEVDSLFVHEARDVDCGLLWHALPFGCRWFGGAVLAHRFESHLLETCPPEKKGGLYETGGGLRSCRGLSGPFTENVLGEPCFSERFSVNGEGELLNIAALINLRASPFLL
jgi:hypothetical protein